MVLSEENAENSSRRLCDGGEASAKRVADTGVGLLIREHRRNWHALTASKLKYISTTLGGRCTVRGNPRDSPRAEMKGRHEKREFFMNGIGMPLELGIAEGELENHVHLGVGAISQEKWESKRSCQNQMKKGMKRDRDCGAAWRSLTPMGSQEQEEEIDEDGEASRIQNLGSRRTGRSSEDYHPEGGGSFADLNWVITIICASRACTQAPRSTAIKYSCRS